MNRKVSQVNAVPIVFQLFHLLPVCGMSNAEICGILLYQIFFWWRQMTSFLQSTEAWGFPWAKMLAPGNELQRFGSFRGQKCWLELPATNSTSFYVQTRMSKSYVQSNMNMQQHNLAFLLYNLRSDTCPKFRITLIWGREEYGKKWLNAVTMSHVMKELTLQT